MNQSRVAIIPSNVVFQCIDLMRNKKYKRQSIYIRLIKRGRSFEIYGSNKANNEALKVKVNDVYTTFGSGHNYNTI